MKYSNADAMMLIRAHESNASTAAVLSSVFFQSPYRSGPIYNFRHPARGPLRDGARPFVDPEGRGAGTFARSVTLGCECKAHLYDGADTNAGNGGAARGAD